MAKQCSLVEDQASISNTITPKDRPIVINFEVMSKTNTSMMSLSHPTFGFNFDYLTIKERVAMLGQYSSFSNQVKLLQFKLPA